VTADGVTTVTSEAATGLTLSTNDAFSIFSGGSTGDLTFFAPADATEEEVKEAEIISSMLSGFDFGSLFG